jgi:hypothetical protein
LTEDLAQRGGLTLRSALQQGHIQINTISSKPIITIAPHLHNTWQASTAIVLLRLVVIKAVQITKRRGQPSASVWDRF